MTGCPVCGGPLVIPATGRRPVYCGQACRQAAHRARVRQARRDQRAAELAAAAAGISAAASAVTRAARLGPASVLAARLAALRVGVDQIERQALGAGRGPTELERWLFAALDADGIAYERYARVGRYRPDALLAGHRVIIEVDGVIWHRRREASDRRRDADLAAAGYTVVRLTDLEMTTESRARALIAAVLADVRAGRQRYRPALLWPAGALSAAPGADPAGACGGGSAA